MLKYIILNELKKELLEIRLQITFILFTVIFIIGSFTYVKIYKNNLKDYENDRSIFLDQEREIAENNLSDFVTYKKDIFQSPRASAFITDGGEDLIPNQFTLNGYNVFDFSIRKGSSNNYIRSYQSLNWAFIAGILISFTVLLLSFDSFTGEKENRTLALAFSHPVSRNTYLFGKYFSIIIISLMAMIPGLCFSLLVLIFSKIILLSGILVFEIGLFLLSTLLLISAMAAIGLLCSLVTRTSGEGLLLTLTIWLFFVFVLPNLTTLAGDYIIPIEPANLVEQRRQDAYDAVDNAAPEHSWSANWGDPFFYANELRARNRMNLMLSDKRVMDDYYNTMFQQFRNLMKISMLSPIGAFEYSNEATSDGGFFRFMKNWDDIHIYQEQLLTYFKEKDAADDKSPHWYNPFEYLSTTWNPANFEEIPMFEERSAGFSERIKNSSSFLLVLIIYSLSSLLVCMRIFRKYDLR